MRLSLELLDYIDPTDCSEAEATVHRYKPEPHFAKHGVGSLSPTSIEERVLEGKRSTEYGKKLKLRHEAGKKIGLSK